MWLPAPAIMKKLGRSSSTSRSPLSVVLVFSCCPARSPPRASVTCTPVATPKQQAAERAMALLTTGVIARNPTRRLLLFQQRLQRGECAFPPESDHLVVPPPAHALLEAVLRDVHARRARTVRMQRHLERHRPDRLAVGRQPERVGNEESLSGVELHDGPSEDAAKAPEDLVPEIGRHPLDRIRTKRARGRHRTRDLPPGV